jgi:ribosomal protein L17
MATTKPQAARAKRAMNPLVTLRAKTIPSKKRVAAKRACRGRVVQD